MWQRFTERARKVVFYAQEEAQKFGGGYVSTEHLLLGLLRETDTAAAQVLDRLGVSLNRIRAEVEKQLPRGDARPNQEMTLTPRAKRVIDLAYDEARNLNNNYIGSEHILLGLIREGNGLVGRILWKLGLELETARREVMAWQEGDGSVRSEATASSPPTVLPWSDDGRRVEEGAVELVATFGDGTLATEHLLMAIVTDDDCIGARALVQIGVHLDVVKARLEGRVPSQGAPPGCLTEWTPRAVVVRRLASDAAAMMECAQIDSGHLVMALSLHTDGLAGQILAEQKIEFKELRDAVAGFQLPKTEPPTAPPTVWSRLTLHARYATLVAQEVASVRSEALVQPTHLLLALLQLPESNAIRLLKALGVDESILERRARSLPCQTEAGDDDYHLISPVTRRCLWRAAKEADLAKSDVIGTEHLLIGLVDEGKEVPSLLSGLGFNPFAARVEICSFKPEEK